MLLTNNLKVTRNNLIHSRAYPKGHKQEVASQQEVAQSYSDVYKLIDVNLMEDSVPPKT